MKKIFLNILLLQLVSLPFIKTLELKAIVPYYSLPTKKILNENSKKIGKNAYQLLYIGQIKESLNLAKLAISLNKSDANLWALLADAQIANNLSKEALNSIAKGKEINPKMDKFYFAESSIFFKQNKIGMAKRSLLSGLNINPNNHTGIFQLGNIYLIEKNHNKALKNFKKVIEINPKFWPAINNMGLIYFELNKTDLAIENFKKAIEIEDNAESILALAASLQNKKNDKKEYILLAKKALLKNPKYVSFKYREEQLWGVKLQEATEKLFQVKELKEDVEFAKFYQN